MIPIIVLVGNSNVGKSTLFNRLTSTCDALVANFPGLTRDRKYGRSKAVGCEFICIDTGGINGMKKEGEGIETRVNEQTLQAIEEADVILFMVDSRAGLMSDDIAIAKYLRSSEKSIFLVVNKIDGLNIDQAMNDFWSLGLGKPYPISASHGNGITNLLETVLKPFSNENFDLALKLNEESEKEKKERRENQFHAKKLKSLPIKLAIVGRPNVGKSTLINCILGEERMVVYEMSGTTRDSIYIPMQIHDRKYVLIDTAGVRNRKKIKEVVEKFAVIKTMQAIEDANVVMLVIDACEGITDQDLSLLNFIINSGRSLVIVINKWDRLNHEIRKKRKEEFNCRIDFIDFARIHFISALYGRGVSNLFKSVREAYDNATRRVSPATLTRIMTMATKDHEPPRIRGRRIKLKYAHAGGYNPPIVVIHGNQVKKLPDFYKRYLMNYFKKSLKIVGTPIKIRLKEEGDLSKIYLNKNKILKCSK